MPASSRSRIAPERGAPKSACKHPGSKVSSGPLSNSMPSGCLKLERKGEQVTENDGTLRLVQEFERSRFAIHVDLVTPAEAP